MIYLTTFMLGNIFSEKIACHNASYKELIEKAFIEVKNYFYSKYFVIGTLTLRMV